MDSKSLVPADVLKMLRQEIRQRTLAVRVITSLEEEVAFDCICGAWLSAENNLSAAIRRIGTRTYRMLVFDHTLCYKRLVQDAVITPELRTLVFGNADDHRDVNVVEYDAAHDVLTLGCYGRFVPEDTSRTREEPHVVEADPADETE